jgi:hypothetical protein
MPYKTKVRDIIFVASDPPDLRKKRVVKIKEDTSRNYIFILYRNNFCWNLDKEFKMEQQVSS